MNIILAAWKYRNYVLIAMTVISFLGDHYYSHYQGIKEGKAICQRNQDKIYVEGVKVYENKKNEIVRLSDPDLDSRLSRWVQ